MKVLLATLLLALPLAGATGIACPTHLVIDGRAQGHEAQDQTQQASVGFCQEIQGGPAPLSREARVLTPLADNVSVRFLDDWGVATLPATITGFGYVNAPLTLTRVALPVASPAGARPIGYELGSWLPIPAQATGTLTATVYLPDGTTQTVSYQKLV